MNTNARRRAQQYQQDLTDEGKSTELSENTGNMQKEREAQKTSKIKHFDCQCI